MCDDGGRARAPRAGTDHANKAGKKILMSGGGRCNFTNLYTEPANFLSRNPHFCKSALARYTQWDFIGLVAKHQVPYHEKKLGQLFCDNKSSDILEMLLRECAEAGAEILLDTSIEEIARDDAGYRLRTSAGEMRCESLVIASGGLSIPTLGASGFGYQVARQFGHEVLPTRAGLVPFTITDQLKELCAELSGTSVDCRVSCNGQAFRENLLFTHRGLSGPAMLQISSYWQPGDTLEIDLLPDHDASEWLAQQQRERPNSELKTLLAELFTKKLAGLLADRWFVSADEAVHPDRTGGYRRAAFGLAGHALGHRGLPHRGSDPGRGEHRRSVVEDHGVAALAGAVFRRRSTGRQRPSRRLQLPVGLGLGLCGGAVRLARLGQIGLGTIGQRYLLLPLERRVAGDQLAQLRRHGVLSVSGKAAMKLTERKRETITCSGGPTCS